MKFKRAISLIVLIPTAFLVWFIYQSQTKLKLNTCADYIAKVEMAKRTPASEEKWRKKINKDWGERKAQWLENYTVEEMAELERKSEPYDPLSFFAVGACPERTADGAPISLNVSFEEKLNEHMTLELELVRKNLKARKYNCEVKAVQWPDSLRLEGHPVHVCRGKIDSVRVGLIKNEAGQEIGVEFCPMPTTAGERQTVCFHIIPSKESQCLSEWGNCGVDENNHCGWIHTTASKDCMNKEL